MSNEIIAAIIQSIAVIFAVVLGFYVTRGTKKLDWRQAQASDFFTCSKAYSEAISKIVTNLFIFYTSTQQTQNKNIQVGDGVGNLIHQLQLLQWEIKRHSLPAHKTREQFLKQEGALFAELSKIIDIVHSEGVGGKVDLETIRTLQNAFDKSARELHAELCSLA
ncbi:MAG: hypothetical protein JO126_01745 [Alphaproteobacteria bacterium]|nr:hypothetical protein [Alphaproteobacteria bacterium]MBV8548160.1 hypothetical protein [Alphaproteobacteria bacterium]